MELKSNQILFEYIFPSKEINFTNRCIWCLKTHEKNKAHIFPKRIIQLKKTQDNILSLSVCKKCNAYWSEIAEDWLFKYSPLATWSDIIISRKSARENYKFIINFAFVEDFNNWCIILFDNNKKNVPGQLIYNLDMQKFFMYGSGFESKNKLIEKMLIFKNKIINKKFHKYIINAYPTNFYPRVFFINDKVIVTAKSENDFNNFMNEVEASNFFNELEKGKLTEQKVIKPFNWGQIYKWSIKKYFLLCTKISIEFLCKIKGSNFVLSEDFNAIRKNCFNINFFDEHNIRFMSREGYYIKNFVPQGWIGMGENFPNKGFKIYPFDIKFPHSHQIYLYCVQNFLVATVRLFSLELCQIILDKITYPFNQIYVIRYDFLNKELSYLSSINRNKSKEMLKDV